MVRVRRSMWGLVFWAVMLIGLAMPGLSWGVDTGVIVYQRHDGTDWEIYTMNPDGSNTKPLTNNTVDDVDPSFSPDGEQIVWSRYDGSDYEIWVMEADGSNPQPLSNNSAHDREPCYSPDKTSIIFASKLDGDYDIFIMDANGANTQPLTANSVDDRYPAFSPDGDTIAYASTDGDWEIWTMDVNDTTNAQKLTNNGNKDISPRYSYNGNKIVFVSDRSGSSEEIWSMNADGSSLARLTSAASLKGSPSYSPEGNYIVFISLPPPTHAIGSIYTIPDTCSLCSSTSWTLIGNAATEELYPYWGPVKSRPKPPSNLVLSNVTATTIDLAWQDNSVNEDEFRIYRGNSADTSTFSQVATNNTNDTTYTDTGLTAKTRYYYYISGYNELGKSAGSNTADTTTLDTQPAFPTNLSATPVNCSDTMVNLTWKDNSGDTWGQETGFVIQRDTEAAFTAPPDKVDTVGTNVTSYTDTGLTRNTTYYYRIRSFSTTFGSRGWAPDTATVITCDTAPNPPLSLVITDTAPTRVDLEWDTPSTNAAGFQIQRSAPDTGSWATVGTTTGDTSFSDTTANPNTHYYYRVRAFNSNGANAACTCDRLFYSAWSNEVDTTTPDTAPLAPSGLTAVINCSDSVILTWVDNSNGSWGNENGFVIERSKNDSSSASFNYLDTASANVTTYKDSNIDSNTTYYYRVKASNTSGTSSASNIASAQSPPAPPGLTATVQSSTSVKLDWSAPGSNATRFCIERSVDPNPSTFAPIKCVDTPTITHQDTVVANNYYYYRVKAENNSCSSDYSDTAGANTNVSRLRVNAYDQVRQGITLNATVDIDWARDLQTIEFDLTFDTNVVSTPAVNQGTLLVTAGVGVAPPTITSLLNGIRARINLGQGYNVNSWTSIVKLAFPVIGNEGATTALTLSGYNLANAQARIIPVIGVANATVKVVKVYPGYCCPKVDDCTSTSNSVCTNFSDSNPCGLDIVCLERILAFLSEEYPIAYLDIDDTPSGDGYVRITDLIAMEYLWACLTPPSWSAPPAPAKLPLSSQVANLVLERSSDQLTLKVNNVEDFHALQLDLGYVPPLRIKEILPGDLTEGAIITTNIENWSGHTYVVLRMPDLKGVSGSGTLLVMPYEGSGETIVNNLVMGNTQVREIKFNLDSVLTTTVKPTRFSLGQNYPNPLNPETWIPFELPQDAKVVISIYNLSGQVVRTLSPGLMKAGSYMDKKSAVSWDGKDNNGREVASGVYLYQLEAGNFKSTRKMILVK
ncbi:MAG: fibronectin type III domain-containing protein [bacterium]|nr:fibronectin type III domain-containing protein [bacterium]